MPRKHYESLALIANIFQTFKLDSHSCSLSQKFKGVIAADTLAEYALLCNMISNAIESTQVQCTMNRLTWE